MSGTSRKRQYLNIKAVYGSSPISMPLQAVAQRHSFRHNHSKKSTLRVFCQRYDLLFSEGEGELNEAKVKLAENSFARCTKLTELNLLIMCALFSTPRSGHLRPGTYLETGG